jgi:hypothetical protein
MECSTGARSRVFSEAFYNARDGIREVLKHLDDLKRPQRLRMNQYAKSRQCLLLDVDINAGPLDADKFRTTIAIECAPGGKAESPVPSARENHLFPSDVAEPNGDRKNTMLIDHVQLGQGVKGRSFPSRTEFSIDKQLKRFGPDVAYVSISGIRKIITRRFASGELQAIMLIPSIEPAISHVKWSSAAARLCAASPAINGTSSGTDSVSSRTTVCMTPR